LFLLYVLWVETHFADPEIPETVGLPGNLFSTVLLPHPPPDSGSVQIFNRPAHEKNIPEAARVIVRIFKTGFRHLVYYRTTSNRAGKIR